MGCAATAIPDGASSSVLPAALLMAPDPGANCCFVGSNPGCVKDRIPDSGLKRALPASLVVVAPF